MSQSIEAGGQNQDCVSAAGVYDAIGNAWEWTSEDVFDGMLRGRLIPQEGFVRQVDAAGIATVTGNFIV